MGHVLTYQERGRAYRLNLDLHRAGGLWLWLLLLVMAVLGVALNLPEQVFRPVLKIATLSPSPLEIAANLPPFNPKDAKLDWDGALASARSEAGRHGWAFTPRYVFYYAACGVGFSCAGEYGENGLGDSYYYVSAKDGRILAGEIMGQGTAGAVTAVRDGHDPPYRHGEWCAGMVGADHRELDIPVSEQGQIGSTHPRLRRAAFRARSSGLRSRITISVHRSAQRLGSQIVLDRARRGRYRQAVLAAL